MNTLLPIIAVENLSLFGVCRLTFERLIHNEEREK
jgi:hypothetical protein